MKKAEQMTINSKVSEMTELAKKTLDSKSYWMNSKPLRSCSATVYDFGDTQILRSYNTVVALIKNGVCYDFLRKVYGYTATSAQHISKFCNDYGAQEKLTYKEC